MASLVSRQLGSLTRYRSAGTSFRCLNNVRRQAPIQTSPSRILSRSQTTYAYNPSAKEVLDQPLQVNTKKPRKIAIRLLYLFIGGAAIVSGLKMAVDIQLKSDPIRAHILPDSQVSPPEIMAIESMITNHPITKELREDTNLTESRPHLKIPLQIRAQVLTSGVLSGVGRIVVPPFVFADKEGKSFTSIQYLGNELCGHPGIIHGGLLATILDEGLARCSFYALPNHIAMTASLEVNYRAPCMADQAVVLKATTTKVEGRKAWVEGRIETMDGKLLVDAKALMIEPKGAANMQRVLPRE